MIAASIFILAALMESPFMPDPPTQPAAGPISMSTAPCDDKLRVRGEKAERAASGAGLIEGLPESYGRSFHSLDGYLVHLQCHAAPVDAPWWLEIEPGVYRYIKTATNARPEVATRAELMRRFGFSR